LVNREWHRAEGAA
jgi:predicted XRE-type DNA-binding protein